MMLKQTIGWLAVLSAAAMLVGCQTGPKDAGQTRAVEIVRDLSGSDPGLKFPDVTLVNSKEQLEKMGSQELLKQDIDFSQCSLIVVSLGQRPTDGYWAAITGVQRMGDVLYVQATTNQPSKAQTVAQTVTYPYTAAVVAKLGAGKVYLEPTSVEGQTPPGAMAPMTAPMAN